jgi:hypothetical protein
MVCALRHNSLLHPITTVRGLGAGSGGRFIDPIYDPGPDDIRNRFQINAPVRSLFDLYQMREASKQMADNANLLHRRTERLIEQREKELGMALKSAIDRKKIASSESS